MTGRGLTFRSPRLTVTIRQSALETFDTHRQLRFYHREAGGQLFGHFVHGHWSVEEATGPRKGDRRGRFSFLPSRASEQREIEAFHARGLEYLGDWHTHPEDVPNPSTKDIDTIQDIVRQSQHHLPGFLMCIVGRTQSCPGLWVSFHDLAGNMTRVAECADQKA
jgi:integrative and conjugative element protein (TIGR02256 family)